MSRREPVPYIGRFAPSPTGPLHFGSLVAAVASYLQAKVNDGQWLLRIEDIDPPRQQAGATATIIEALERYGFEWQGDALLQSASHLAHERALASLLKLDLAYPCGCSRRDLADAKRGPLGVIYPGTCRTGCNSEEVALRLRTDDRSIGFVDALQGRITQRLQTESGDFIVRRRDGLSAYHLAVVVDDALQGITEVVRGIDLLDSTPRQIWLQQLLSYPTPDYVHIPVITHTNGDKLSKLTGAPGIPLTQIRPTLLAALAALELHPPPDLVTTTLNEIWLWAAEHWRLGPLKGQTAIVKTS
jgi:glutamyl-Q tRNA(Asp) synthetase